MPQAAPRLEENGHLPAPKTTRDFVQRWWPVLALVAVGLAAYGLGLNRQLSLAGVAANRDALKGFVADHRLAAIVCYAGLYVAMTVASLPAAAVMSIAGGFLFGWGLSAPLSAISATTGATIVYYIVSTTAGRALAGRAGPFVARFQRGFGRDAFLYLLSLRLLPVVPFFIVNAVAGLARVNVWTFIAATAIGIIPGALAYAWLGTGLDSVIAAQQAAFDACVAAKGATACRFDLQPSALMTPQLVTAFVALGMIALLPLVLRRFKRRPIA